MIRILLLALSLVAAGASAQTWPAKPVHFVVAGAAGSAPDIIARLIADRLTPMWGQQIVVENRVGNAGNLGTAAAAKAAPDGYTILFGQAAPLALSPVVFKQLDFDPEKDFAPIVRVGLSPMMISAGKDFAPKTIPELVAAAKAAPGKINYGTSSQRNIPHLTGVLLANQAGVQLTHVPYSSNSLAATEASTGLTQLYIDGIPPMTGHIKAGRLRPIAVTSAKRLPNFPDVPTVAETLPGFEFNGWFAILAPAGTPADILARINRDVNTVLRSPDMGERLLGFGIYEPGGTPEELAAFMRSERENYRNAVRAGGIQPE